MEQQGSVELDVGIQSTVRLVFTKQAQRCGLDAPGQLVETLIATAGKKALCRFGQNVGARITHAVHTMSESHEAFAPIKPLADNCFRAVRSPNFEDHVQRRTWSPAM